MKSNLRIALFGLALLASSIGFAGNLAGNWQGKFFVSGNATQKMLAGKSPSEQKGIKEMLGKLLSATVQLKLGSDTKFTLDAIDFNTGKAKKYEGSWKMAGNNVLLSPKLIDGKKIDTSKGQMELTYDPKAGQLLAPWNTKDFNMKLSQK